MLDCRQDTLVFVLHSWLRHTRLTPSEPNVFILVSSDHRTWFQWSMSLVCLSSANRLYCASSLEEASFCDYSHADQFDAVCGVWSEHWQADPPTPSTSAVMLAALICLFPKHNLWIWHWAHALNFFGRPWRGLFWAEPVLLNRFMVLATVLQLNFRVLAIFL